jgi:hypothetical protein
MQPAADMAPKFLSGPLVLAALAPLQDKDAIWHAPPFATKLNQKKIIQVLPFHHQENIIAALFSQKLKLKVSSCSTTTIPQTSNLHSNSSHD